MLQSQYCSEEIANDFPILFSLNSQRDNIAINWNFEITTKVSESQNSVAIICS